MAKEINQLQKRIMRRVYYAFVIRILSHPYITHGALMLFSFIVLTQFVSVPAIWNNVMSIEVGSLGSYILGALTDTEFLTLFLLGIIIFSAFSLRFQLRTPKLQKTQVA